MNPYEALVTYSVSWWIIFMMALPFGSVAPDEPLPGHATSAPERPRLWLKAGITTVLAAFATWGVAWFVQSGFIDIRQ